MKKPFIYKIACVLLLAGIFQIGIQAAAGQSNVVPVPGTGNLWLAGQPNGVTAAGGDSAPAQSPVGVSLIDFSPGDELAF